MSVLNVFGYRESLISWHTQKMYALYSSEQDDMRLSLPNETTDMSR